MTAKDEVLTSSGYIQHHLTNAQNIIPASFGTTNVCFSNNAKTKMTALARSVDLNGRWTHFEKPIKITGLGKKSGFISPP